MYLVEKYCKCIELGGYEEYFKIIIVKIVLEIILRK